MLVSSRCLFFVLALCHRVLNGSSNDGLMAYCPAEHTVFFDCCWGFFYEVVDLAVFHKPPDGFKRRIADVVLNLAGVLDGGLLIHTQ